MMDGEKHYSCLSKFLNYLCWHYACIYMVFCICILLFSGFVSFFPYIPFIYLCLLLLIILDLCIHYNIFVVICLAIYYQKYI